MKTKKITRAQKEASGTPKPAQSKYELRKARPPYQPRRPKPIE